MYVDRLRVLRLSRNRTEFERLPEWNSILALSSINIKSLTETETAEQQS